MAEEYGFDSQAMRPYFEYERVKKGVLDITGAHVRHRSTARSTTRRCGTRRSTSTTCSSGGDALLGRIYLDMHPRDGKYKHYAQFTLANGVAGRALPEGVLMCNFPRPRAAEPALMEHGERAHVLPRVRPPPAPRARRPHALGRAVGRGDGVGLRRGAVADARGVDLGPGDAADVRAPLPDRRAAAGGAAGAARAADEYGKGLWVRQQMFYAAISLEFHARDPRGLDTTKLMAELQRPLHAVQVRRGHLLPRDRSATSMATRRSTTRICGRW